MRKILVISCVLLMTLLTTIALAESNELEEYTIDDIECHPTVLAVGQIAEWQVFIEPANDCYTYDYYLLHQSLDDTSMVFYSTDSMIGTESPVYTYEINAEGRYILEVYIYDYLGNVFAIDQLIYTTDIIDSNDRSLSGVIAEIAASCTAAGHTILFHMRIMICPIVIIIRTVYYYMEPVFVRVILKPSNC